MKRHQRPIQCKARHQSQPSALSATPATKTKIDVAKCHACDVRGRQMSPSATPATQSAAASPATNPVQARHQSQPSALSATLAIENESKSKCHEVPRPAT